MYYLSVAGVNTVLWQRNMDKFIVRRPKQQSIGQGLKRLQQLHDQDVYDQTTVFVYIKNTF